MTRWRPVLMPSGMVMFIPPPEFTVTYGTPVCSTQTVPFTRKPEIPQSRGLPSWVSAEWRRLCRKYFRT